MTKKKYSQSVVYIENPYPPFAFMKYNAIMDFVDVNRKIIHRALLIYRPGEPDPIPVSKISSPDGITYNEVHLHGEHFKLKILKHK